MRYASKADDNQKELVAALRKLGASVHSLHRVGEGVPDLLVGYQNKTYLFEVKNRKGKNKIGEAQRVFMLKWQGGTAKVVRDLGDVLEALRNDK